MTKSGTKSTITPTRKAPATPPTKHDQILTVALRLFLQEGFQGLSMDRLAAAVPVSKPTLYAHFADKAALFAAVISTRCATALQALQPPRSGTMATPSATLAAFGNRFTAMLYEPEALQFHRMMTAEAQRVPDMAKLFYNTGPAKVRQSLADYLAQLDAQGDYLIPQPAESADLFLGMLKGARHMRCLLNLEKLPGKAERERLVANAVRVFLGGHRHN